MEAAITDIALSDLATALAKISDALPGSKSQHPRSSLSKVAEFLGAHSEKRLSELVIETEAAKPTVTKKSTASGPKKPKSPPKPANKAVIDDYLEQLKAAELQSPEAFEELLVKLSNDEAAKAPELAEIFFLYTGNATKKMSKKDRISGLREVFSRRWKDAVR